jgi:hypothetical protein
MPVPPIALRPVPPMASPVRRLIVRPVPPIASSTVPPIA